MYRSSQQAARLLNEKAHQWAVAEAEGRVSLLCRQRTERALVQSERMHV